MIKKIARWILRKEIAKLKGPRLYDDLYNPDRLHFWKDMAKGIDQQAAKSWAFERLNRRLKDIITIAPENSHLFYVYQGAIAELNNFINLHTVFEAELADDMKRLEPAKKDGEAESMSKINE